MSKNFLNIKRYNNTNNIPKNCNETFKNKFNVVCEKKKNQRNISNNNSNSSGNIRTIIVYKNNEKIVFKTDSLQKFQKFVFCFNCLFYVVKGVKHYLLENKSIELFFLNNDFHTLYDTDYKNEFTEEQFKISHNFPKRKDCKIISDFCFFPDYVFSTNDHKYFYTAKWSPNRVLKFYRFTKKNYVMREEFNNCSNPKILKIYGPKGTGKSTLVYAFFATMSSIEINLDKIDNKILNQNEIKLKEFVLISKENVVIKKIKNSQNVLQEVDALDIENLNDSNDSKENIITTNNNNINIIENEESENIITTNNNVESEDNKKDENDLLENLYYLKEFKSGKNNEDYYFLSSLYIDLDKERTPELSKINKNYFEVELMQLFKTYKFYQYLLIYLYGDKKDNIFDRLKQIIKFMLEAKNNRNYFIILDHISEKEQKEIIELETYSYKDPFCYLIELPLIITREEKINFLKDIYLKETDELESYDRKDYISYIKRNSNYGIIYSTNFYKPEINDDDEDDKIFKKNFGENIYLYCLWKYNNEKIAINNFITQILEDLIQIFKEYYNNDENELALNIRTLLDIVENKKDVDNINFLSRLPLEYFVIINNNNKYRLEYSFPLVSQILKNLNISDGLQILKTRNFITYFDNYVKGGIIEKVFVETIEKNYNKILNRNLEIINIEKMLDNQIRDYFNYEEVKYILGKNNKFMEIYRNKNNLKNKNIIFKQVQNAKHYDLGIKLFNKGNNYFFCQISYHKSHDDLINFLNFMYIDLNYMINKLIYFCDEEKESIIGIYIIFILMDLSSYKLENITNIESEIIHENKNNNSALISKLNNYKIDYLMLDSNGNLTQEGKIIESIPFKFNLVNQFNLKIKELRIKKINTEKKYTEIFKKILKKKKLVLLFYSPFHKKKKGNIMINIFEDSNLNYYEIEGLSEKQFYNINGDELNENYVYKIEKKNYKKRKMNILIKIN